MVANSKSRPVYYLLVCCLSICVGSKLLDCSLMQFFVGLFALVLLVACVRCSYVCVAVIAGVVIIGDDDVVVVPGVVDVKVVV